MEIAGDAIIWRLSILHSFCILLTPLSPSTFLWKVQKIYKFILADMKKGSETTNMVTLGDSLFIHRTFG